MPIKEIGLISFRNHDEIKLTFCPNINVIWGKNGSGKTAILEAIHSLSIGRSFRTNRKNELLKEGAEYFSITGKFGNSKSEQNIQINQMNDGTRRILINDTKLENVRELVGLNPVVLLSPEEQIVTKGTPQEQRNYFNKLFSIISIDYFNILSDYNKILKQRNKLLAEFYEINSAEDELAVWNEQIVNTGLELWESRKIFAIEYFEKLNGIVKKFKGSGFSFKGEIISNIPSNEKEYIKKLNTVKGREIYLGRTTLGPHKDKIKFTFNGKNIRQFGSQGEHKLALLLIKLAEVEMIREKGENEPIILLDDLFAKLDDERSKQAMEMLSGDLQIIITTTDLKIVEDRGIKIDNKNNGSFYLD